MTIDTAPAQSVLAPATAARSPQERSAQGKDVRKALPLGEHARVPDQPIDAVALLHAEDRDRVPELVPVRYGRMLASALAFYRGSAVVMAEDLAALPHTGLVVQLCGDAHLSNFGVYASPERRLVFDLNDFDETLPGPFEWDLKRLAASLAITGRANGHGSGTRRKTVLHAVSTYRTAMRGFADMGNLAVWYARLDAEQAVADLASTAGRPLVQRTEDVLKRARLRDSADAVRKLTRSDDGRLRFRNEPPLIVPVAELFADVDADALRNDLLGVLSDYRGTLVEDRRRLLDQFAMVDVARKVVGVGSVGTRAFVVLLTGRDANDALVLQVKQAGASVLERYLGPSEHEQSGERVVAGQRLMQATSDIFLGWHRTVGTDGEARDFYVRQLRDGKASAVVEQMVPRGLTLYGGLCAWSLARAHARSGDRIALAAYMGKSDTFDRAIADFAEAYADRAERQYRQLQDAVRDGRITATSGV